METRLRKVWDVLAELAHACGRSDAPDRGWLEELCRWPPDAFALASLVLGESGGYRRCVSPPADQRWPPKPRATWLKELGEGVRAWRGWAYGRGGTPPVLTRLLDLLTEHDTTPLSEIASSDHAWTLTSALLELLALSDETCAGMGFFVPAPKEADEAQQALITFANDFLTDSGSLCYAIPPDYLRVLAKRHTPQNGLSLRSLSLHLAMVRGEVTTRWQVAQSSKLKRTGRVNLLIVPWPLEIIPAAFTEAEPAKAEKTLEMDEEHFGFFDFDPPAADVPGQLAELLAAAEQRVGFVDAVVFPECALHESQIPEIEKVLDDPNHGVSLYLTGVRAARRNSALLGVREHDRWTPSNQDKHHRWYLDRSQIEMYGLGGALHPAKRWWENIDVGPRTLHFVTPADWLTLCHLVCEDLARQDPVAHAVRSVGPSLVIALLLDGPQLKDRWAARYATVLADDPGSSVLTLTSLGMALRSTPPGRPPSRVIALWKDAGSAVREIELAQGAGGVVLSVCAVTGAEEHSADGRSTGRTRTMAVLAGVEQISVPEHPANRPASPQPNASAPPTPRS